MAHHGIILADAARARFFTADVRLEELEEVLDLVHPESQMAGRETHTDGPGRFRGDTPEPPTER